MVFHGEVQGLVGSQARFPPPPHQVTSLPTRIPASNERRAGSQVVSQFFQSNRRSLFPFPTPASMSSALTSIDLPELQLLNRGKVRDVYATSDPTALLFVASDRISAYDVILNNVRHSSPIPFQDVFEAYMPTWVICLLDTGHTRQRRNFDENVAVLV